MRRKRRFSRQELDDIRSRFLKNESFSEMGNAYGISKAQMHSICTKILGLNRDKKPGREPDSYAIPATNSHAIHHDPLSSQIPVHNKLDSSSSVSSSTSTSQRIPQDPPPSPLLSNPYLSSSVASLPAPKSKLEQVLFNLLESADASKSAREQARANGELYF